MKRKHLKSSFLLAALAAILALVPAEPAAAQSSAFSIVPISKAFGSPYAASPISPTDVWAVGLLDGLCSSTKPGVCPRPINQSIFHETLIEHWNGTQWRIVPSPNVGFGFFHDNLLQGVTAVSANDMWAVGWFENTAIGKLSPLFEHWNGASWQIVNTDVRDNVTLNKVSAVSTNDIWAVGIESIQQDGVYHALGWH